MTAHVHASVSSLQVSDALTDTSASKDAPSTSRQSLPDDAAAPGMAPRPRVPAASRRRSEVRQRTELVALRLLPGELELLSAAAEDRNVSLSELIRSSALKAVGR